MDAGKTLCYAVVPAAEVEEHEVRCTGIGEPAVLCVDRVEGWELFGEEGGEPAASGGRGRGRFVECAGTHAGALFGLLVCRVSLCSGAADGRVYTGEEEGGEDMEEDESCPLARTDDASCPCIDHHGIDVLFAQGLAGAAEAAERKVGRAACKRNDIHVGMERARTEQTADDIVEVRGEQVAVVRVLLERTDDFGLCGAREGEARIQRAAMGVRHACVTGWCDGGGRGGAGTVGKGTSGG